MTIQTLLGDHHDSVVSRAHIADQADTAHAAGEVTFTYGLLHEREATLAHQCEQQLHAAIEITRHGRCCEALTAAVQRPGGAPLIAYR